jgi:hypothetical protein
MSHTRIPTTPLIERAYALARSGDCRDAADIGMCLVAEGYYLGGDLERPALKRDLLRVCHEARSQKQ